MRDGKSTHRRIEKTSPIYYDTETRETWQPLPSQLFKLDKTKLTLLNRFGRLRRLASFSILQFNEPQSPHNLKHTHKTTNNTINLPGLESLEREDDAVSQQLKEADPKPKCWKISPFRSKYKQQDQSSQSLSQAFFFVEVSSAYYLNGN